MSDLKIRPLGDRVVLEESPAESKTASGLIIPDTAKEKPNKGIVMAFGENKSGFKIGDTVLYGKFAGTTISIDGKDYLKMREADIFMIL